MEDFHSRAAGDTCPDTAVEPSCSNLLLMSTAPGTWHKSHGSQWVTAVTQGEVLFMLSTEQLGLCL